MRGGQGRLMKILYIIFGVRAIMPKDIFFVVANTRNVGGRAVGVVVVIGQHLAIVL